MCKQDNNSYAQQTADSGHKSWSCHSDSMLVSCRSKYGQYWYRYAFVAAEMWLETLNLYSYPPVCADMHLIAKNVITKMASERFLKFQTFSFIQMYDRFWP